MISNGNDEFKAKDVKPGMKALQIIGSWDESAVSELVEAVDQHRSGEARNSTASRFRMVYGKGHTLG